MQPGRGPQEMNGVYAWIREGVRRAVLLGFSDAVHQLGIPHDEDQMHPQLTGILQQSPVLEGPQTVTPRTPRSGGRKRLGRSLNATATKETAKETAGEPDTAAS